MLVYMYTYMRALFVLRVCRMYNTHARGLFHASCIYYIRACIYTHARCLFRTSCVNILCAVCVYICARCLCCACVVCILHKRGVCVARRVYVYDVPVCVYTYARAVCVARVSYL